VNVVVILSDDKALLGYIVFNEQLAFAEFDGRHWLDDRLDGFDGLHWLDGFDGLHWLDGFDGLHWLDYCDRLNGFNWRYGW
jgi:hypothetical protein